MDQLRYRLEEQQVGLIPAAIETNERVQSGEKVNAK